MKITRLALTTVLWIGLHEATQAQDTHYVAQCGQTPVSAYTDWTTAASNIQDAINAAAVSDTVLVTNGTYTVTSQISIGIGITVKSVNGATSTFVNGNYPWTTNRCFYVGHANAVVDGFTITNGAVLEAAVYGGGVRIDGGILRNCTITGNRAGAICGGVLIYGGTVSNCIINGNWAHKDGGGIDISGGTIQNCAIYGNSTTSTAWYGGGGVKIGGGTMLNCTIYNNWAANRGGGVLLMGGGGTVRNCLITSNSTSANGGGVFFCDGGGTIQNCTIVSNSASSYGGGVYMHNNVGGFVQNTIIYSNTAASGGANYSNAVPCSYSNCCFFPALSDASTNYSANNITNNPLWVDFPAWNFRLLSGSPCINAGVNLGWMNNAVDLDGYRRLDRFSSLPDMGCYEYVPQGTIYTFH